MGRFQEPLICGLLFLLITGTVAAEAAVGAATVWDFENEQEGRSPPGFSFTKTGDGSPGRWVIQAEADAPSGKRALAQTDTDMTDFRFPMAIADEPLLTDLRLSVKCQPISGKIDQACGLVLRYRDEQHYYITRANALEQNVRFYKIVNGQRQQLASWSGAVASGIWHQLQVEAQGDRFVVFWDGQRVMEIVDQTFREAGKIGLWTKADSMTVFDDLTVEPLNSSP